MIAAAKQSLGFGAYDMAEVSRYTRIPSSTVRSWFRGEHNLLHSDFDLVDGDFAVSFNDLVDALVAGQLRKRGVTMALVRRAYAALRQQLETSHPFCHSAIYTDGRKVFTDSFDAIGKRQLVEVITRQHFFDHVRRCLDKMVYSGTTGLATRWLISEGVVIDPTFSLGKPVIEGRGVTTYVLANQYYANHSKATLVADLYDVTVKEVHHAVHFEDEYGLPRKAA